MEIQRVVAHNLRRLRVLSELSQDALAAEAEVDRTYVSRMERGMENPTVVILDRLAKALEVDIVEFFVRPKPGEKPPAPLKGGRKPKG